MTIPLLLPAVALIAAPAQEQTTPPPAPPVVAPAPVAGSAPIVAPAPIVVPASPVADSPTVSSSAASPEFADPLSDPETAVPATAGEAPFRATAVDPNRGDPLEGFNRAMFGIHQTLDKAIYRPLAMGYQHVVPKPVRSGLRNFFSNLTEPVVFLNYLLQFKFGKAAETLVRFTVNSTLGVGGFFDIAKTEDFKLPHRNNSFGDTLAYYGVGPGPYLFLPLVGPTTLRDALGGPVDGAVLPVSIGKPFTDWRYQFSSGLITGLDLRAESDPELRALFGGAVDPYATLRSVWLQNRAAEVSDLHHHRPKLQSPSELDDPLRDPGAPAAPRPESGARELQDPLADPAAPIPAVTPY
ncbi:MlaA family lipoprotein [Sphingomonas asaccharolytica]|uniref:MlaA family lipoprotein n=1 Tax=Sphingomonas asaccharolytica TaxID=40681 RepID=UPI000AE80B24|nr:VacJ family lipoprotein [Sphingomonas asaccharolytica]